MWAPKVPSIVETRVKLLYGACSNTFHSRAIMRISQIMLNASQALDYETVDLVWVVLCDTCCNRLKSWQLHSQTKSFDRL